MIDITEKAEKRIEEICVSENVYALTLEVIGSNCSGLQFDWGIAEEEADIETGEEIFECGRGKLAVGITSLAFMKGSTVDYISDILNSKFEIISPNSSCGCGV